MNTSIKPVQDNYDKRYTYTVLIDQYKKAYEGEFYFESLFLVYAMMEDRLRSILYHSKVTKKKDSEKPNNPETKELMENIFFQETTHNKDTHEFDFKSIAEKREMVEAIIKWSQKVDTQNQIEEDLKMQFQDTEKYLEVLEAMKEWCSYRNKLIHAIFDKNIDSINLEIKDKVVQGFTIAKEISNLANKIKNV